MFQWGGNNDAPRISCVTIRLAHLASEFARLRVLQDRIRREHLGCSAFGALASLSGKKQNKAGGAREDGMTAAATAELIASRRQFVPHETALLFDSCRQRARSVRAALMASAASERPAKLRTMRSSTLMAPRMYECSLFCRRMQSRMDARMGAFVLRSPAYIRRRKLGDERKKKRNYAPIAACVRTRHTRIKQIRVKVRGNNIKLVVVACTSDGLK